MLFSRINWISSFSWQFRMQFPSDMWNSSTNTVYSHICDRHLPFHASIRGKCPGDKAAQFFVLISFLLPLFHPFHNLSAFLFLFTSWHFGLGTFSGLPSNKLLLIQIFWEECSTSVYTVTLTQVWAHSPELSYIIMSSTSSEGASATKSCIIPASEKTVWHNFIHILWVDMNRVLDLTLVSAKD